MAYEPDPRADQTLARHAAMGDRSAFAEIFHRYGAGLYRYVLRILDGDFGDVEDAVQDRLPAHGCTSGTSAANPRSRPGFIGWPRITS